MVTNMIRLMLQAAIQVGAQATTEEFGLTAASIVDVVVDNLDRAMARQALSDEQKLMELRLNSSCTDESGDTRHFVCYELHQLLASIWFETLDLVVIGKWSQATPGAATSLSFVKRGS